MSADNTIVILKTRSEQFAGRAAYEYRVAHVQNAEDIHKHNVPNWGRRVVGTPNWDYIHSYFDKCRVFYSRDLALGYAMRLDEEVGFVEYGIWEIDDTYPKPVEMVVYDSRSGAAGHDEVTIRLENCYLSDGDSQGVLLTQLLRDDWRKILENAK